MVMKKTTLDIGEDTKEPISFTELQYRISEEIREKIIKNLVDGRLIGETIEINIVHWSAGQLGILKCEIKEWIPKVNLI